MATTNERLAELIEMGFDESYALGRNHSGQFTKAIRVKCSQCEALVINGWATHEQRCPNTPRETDDEYFDE